MELSTSNVQETAGTGKLNETRERGRPIGDRSAQRSKLIAAVMSVIAEEGYVGASVRKVALRAGFTTGAVSYYFDNKETMMVAAAEQLFDEFDAMLDAMQNLPSVKESAERWLEWMSDTELWMVNAQLGAYAAGEPNCAEVFSRRYARYRENYATILEGWQESGSVRKDLPADVLTDHICAISDGWMHALPVEPARFSPERLPKLIDGLVRLLSPPVA